MLGQMDTLAVGPWESQSVAPSLGLLTAQGLPPTLGFGKGRPRGLTGALVHMQGCCSSSQAQLEGPFCGEHPREKLRLPRLFAAELGPRLPEESLWLSSQGQEGRWRRRALDSGRL